MAFIFTKSEEILLDSTRTTAERQYKKYQALSKNKKTQLKSIVFLRVAAEREHEEAIKTLEDYEKDLLDSTKTSPLTQYYMYKNYMAGNGFYRIIPNPEKAKKFLQASCRVGGLDGFPEAQIKMSAFLKNGNSLLNIKVNKTESMRYLEASARLSDQKAGNNFAKYLMAQKYKHGDGVELSHRLYIKYLSHAAMRRKSSKGLMKAKTELRSIITHGNCLGFIIDLPHSFISSLLDLESNYVLSDFKKAKIMEKIQERRNLNKREQQEEHSGLKRFEKRYGEQKLSHLKSGTSSRAAISSKRTEIRFKPPVISSNFFGSVDVENRVRLLVVKSSDSEELAIA